MIQISEELEQIIRASYRESDRLWSVGHHVAAHVMEIRLIDTLCQNGHTLEEAYSILQERIG